MLITIALLILILVIIWLLTATITLTVDTEDRDYSLRVFGLFEVRLLLTGREFLMDMRAPFFHKVINIEQEFLRAHNKTRKPVVTLKADKKSRGNLYFARQMRKNWRGILNSFHVRRFRLNLDTDDFIINSFLFPIACLAQQQGYYIGINFLGKRNLSIIIQNRLANILLAFLKP